MEDTGKIGGLDISDILKKFDFSEMVAKKGANLKKLNIINVGKTGVGKSTLINAVFGETLAKTGTGDPVTQHCERYTLGNSHITIYDSKGIETGDNTKALNEIYDLISKQNNSNKPDQYIHICWYCISAEGLRIDDNEVDIIKKIRRMPVPVIIVLTQFAGSQDQETFITDVKNKFDENIDLFPIMALPKQSQGKYGSVNISAHGIDELSLCSWKLLPDSVQATFAAHAKSVELKIKTARIVSIPYAGAVAAAAFQPLPIADAPIMIAIQVAMMAHLTVCFGIDKSTINFKTILSGLGGPFLAAVIGRTLVSLVKFVPGLGTIVGGVINATTGGVLTFAIAQAYIAVLSSVIKKNGKIDQESLGDALKAGLQNIDMKAMKKEWENNKNNASQSEVDAILNDAKKSIE